MGLLGLLTALWPVAIAGAQDKAPAAKGAEAPARKATHFEALIDRTLPSLVKVYGAGGFRGIPAYGTGIVIDKRGLVLTAWSVSLKTEDLKAVDHQGRTFPCTLHRRDARRGVALLKIKSKDTFKPIELAPPGSATVGDTVLSFGNCFDVAVGVEKLSVVEGVISCLTELDARVGVVTGRIDGKVFLTDAANNPGTQGGALVDLKGRLVGVNGRVVESRSTNTPLNFSVPLDSLRELIKEGAANFDKAAKITDGELAPREAVIRVDVGLEILRYHFNRPPPAWIDHIDPDSPASEAGLQVDDLIFQINGETVRTTTRYDELLATLEPGTPAVFTVKRGNEILRFKVTPAKAAKPRALEPERRGEEDDDEDPVKPVGPGDMVPEDAPGTPDAAKPDDAKPDDAKPDGGAEKEAEPRKRLKKRKSPGEGR